MSPPADFLPERLCENGVGKSLITVPDPFRAAYGGAGRGRPPAAPPGETQQGEQDRRRPHVLSFLRTRAIVCADSLGGLHGALRRWRGVGAPAVPRVWADRPG